LINARTYDVDDIIICNGQINQASMNNGFTAVTLNVGDAYIELLPNFEANGEIDFNALISDCDLSD